MGNLVGPAKPPAVPAVSPPGSLDKIAELEGRAERGEDLHAPGDKMDYEDAADHVKARSDLQTADMANCNGGSGKRSERRVAYQPRFLGVSNHSKSAAAGRKV